MNWNHIMDKQPENGESIIHIDRPYKDGHYCMGMRNYIQDCSFEEVLKFCKDYEWPKPDFWWISAKDFPFPDKEI
jgi:hypothetical protein